ncbi:Aldo/keto reductase [Cryphonectria parasitica EP155]|uniref:Aldo/keto reductase n=1 Tax=Cryphonectria parasitica (strain ATCC 38755 / EP155) TaxID=660469 RepID=A0A9P4Y7C8_CRYP1|nr:Aldo/keto reductase [Cryphonectria parasitica EP155]KAF3767712.1 Aldo/keto reductase [Cryphonectria parasitica EP155]
MTKSITLSSGYEMPLVGYGIWKVPKENAADSVYNAIKLGYRHIDGAHDYQNSAEAGEGVRKALDEGVCKREELFITSKLWNNYHAKPHVLEMAAFENKNWGVDYLDLYLIHFPIAQQHFPMSELKYPCFWSDAAQKNVAPQVPVPIQETWQALESLVISKDNPKGILRSIGVANFNASLLYDVLRYAKIKPAVNQVEHHPYLVQPGLIQMCQENGIVVTAYSSFGPQSFLELKNKRALDVGPLFENETVAGIAKKHGKTPAQVLLRWATQRDIIVIPKSNNQERLAQNLDSTDFDLTAEELASISALDKGLRFNDPADFGIRIFA